MNLNVTDLYSDKVWADLDALLSVEQKKDLLQKGQEYCEALGTEGVECSIEFTSPVSFLRSTFDHLAKPKKSKLNRALVISADFDPYEFKAIITISTFSAGTVMGVYKTLSREGEKIFVVNHSAEARRRTLIGLLVNVEAIDRFFLVDKSLDMVAEFIESELKTSIKKSLVSP